MIDASAASYLILPAGHARQFRDALLAHASSSHGDGLLDGVGHQQAVGLAPGEKVARKTHIVKRGESLWADRPQLLGQRQPVAALEPSGRPRAEARPGADGERTELDPTRKQP